MNKRNKDICPICNGTGKFEIPNKMEIDTLDIKKKIAVELREKGYSIRQIQVALGYKSPRSIHIFVGNDK